MVAQAKELNRHSADALVFNSTLLKTRLNRVSVQNNLS